MKNVLTMKNISKEYFGNKVLKNVNLSINEGEIHALLGENGAGKSTLMNILFGMPVIHSTGGFSGEVFMNESPININSPNIAMSLGIGMVHQEFMLLPDFTISENIKLNREITKKNFFSYLFGKSLNTLDYESMNKDSKAALDAVNLNIDEYVKVNGLPVGYMQFIEICREIDKSNLKLLVFDEPTAVLTESEAEMLMDAMVSLAKKGIAIIFITHRLDEVMKVADNVTILRDGELICSKNKKDTSILELAELMVGRTLDSSAVYENDYNYDKKEVVMEIKNLVVNMPGEVVNGIDLNIYKGEILGIAGLAGQGKIGIANGIMGIYDSTGLVKVNNKDLPLNNVTSALKNNLAFVSEDRRGVGLLLDESIEENIAITSMNINKSFLRKYGLITQSNKKEIRKHAGDMISNLDIRCTGPTQLTKRLSGGNQQKVCIARALTMNPKILFISEPTRGIDVGAKKIILDLLYKLNKEQEMTIVITSSELHELKSICTRICVVSEGKIGGILSPKDKDLDFGLIMSGNKKEDSYES